ncbi:hypothetical protein ACQPZA_23870 [Pseudonocardia xinjiangensis]|uniref:hypothetical protein n=1 Tax=Pseudonocardia xinjiangensis TaxID=75289 RepID=UPI003D9042B9
MADAEAATSRAQSRARLATDLAVAATTVAVLAAALLGPAPVPLANASLIALLTAPPNSPSPAQERRSPPSSSWCAT